MGSLKRDKIIENAAEAFNQSRKNQQDVALLKTQLERQKCLISALWQVMKDRMGLADSDLQSAFEDVSAKHKTRNALACQTCGRPLQESSTACIYCGAPAPDRPIA